MNKPKTKIINFSTKRFYVENISELILFKAKIYFT